MDLGHSGSVGGRCTCHAAIAPIDRFGNYECPQHGYFAKARKLSEVRDLVRELGSVWRANDDEAISNALARLEDAVGLVEQGASKLREVKDA